MTGSGPGSRYQILRELGTGATATVYLALDGKLGRTVALKILHRHLLSNPGVTGRFQLEAQAIASLSHENLVALYDVEESANGGYLVMEHVEGVTLETLLERHPVLPNLVLLEITRQLFEGLSAAHGSSIIHRDIKPSNILLDGKGCLKITDFGVAHILNRSVLTEAGQFLGTPGYTSPESIKGGKLTDRLDIFSAGCLLYQGATGTFPFQGENPHRILREICDASPIPATEKNPKLIPEIASWLDKMLSKDPLSRPAGLDLVRNINEFTLRSRLSLGRERLREFLKMPEEYTLTEEAELHGYFLREAVTQKEQGKSAQSHRSLYRAGLFGKMPAMEKEWWNPIRKKKQVWMAVIGLAGLIAAGLWFQGYFQPSSPGSVPDSSRVDSPPSEPAPPLERFISSGTDNILPTRNVSDRKAKRTHPSSPPPTRPAQLESKEPVSPPALEKATVAVRIKTRPPFARIYIDDNQMGNTPLSLPLSLQPGKYRLRIEKPGYEKVDQELEVSEGDSLEMALNLKRLP